MMESSTGTFANASIDEIEFPAPEFDRFTFPRYRPLLLGNGQMEKAQQNIAVGAWLDHQPVGLALLSRQFGEGERRMLSIMVGNAWRRRGLGSRLLSVAETLAGAQGTRKLCAFHSTQSLSRAAYEQLMNKAGWSLPDDHQFRLAGKAVWALQAAQDWAPFLSRLRERGFAATPWSDITPRDREQISALVAGDLPEADRSFDPLICEKRLDALADLSLLLRRHGQVVGWLLGSAGALPGIVHYSNGYVLPSLQKSGWLIAGVREVCERQAELYGADSLSVFETSPHNVGMRRFMARQIERYQGWMDARVRCEKTIAASA